MASFKVDAHIVCKCLKLLSSHVHIDSKRPDRSVSAITVGQLDSCGMH